MAAFVKPMYVNFHLDGSAYRVLVPPQYYKDDMNSAALKGIVQKDIVQKAGSRVVDVSDRIPLKLLAARAGLGYYGRNNLIFVEGMGSYNLLYAFLTDHQFAEDGWTPLEVLDRCRRCDHCDRICPTGSILRSNFVIDIDKCLTLYNENPGAFPNWMPPSAHHALMGCLKCQSPCPVNGGIADLYGTMEDISEEETRKILKGSAGRSPLERAAAQAAAVPGRAVQAGLPGVDQKPGRAGALARLARSPVVQDVSHRPTAARRQPDALLPAVRVSPAGNAPAGKEARSARSSGSSTSIRCSR